MLWKRKQPEHRQVNSFQDAVTLFAERNVSARVTWRGGAHELDIEPDSLLGALLALPEAERLPKHLEDYLTVARAEADQDDADNLTRYRWAVPLALAGAYLIGLAGDRRGALAMLEASYRQWANGSTS